jgi:hypothetical protein
MGYYEAAGRRSALALADLDLLIRRTDQRLERIAQAAEAVSAEAGRAAYEAGALAGVLREQTQAIGSAGSELLAASTGAVQQLNARLGDERFDQMAGALAASSENTLRASANVAEATGYVRDMLSPAKKSFWRKVVELLIPRPQVSVGP